MMEDHGFEINSCDKILSAKLLALNCLINIREIESAEYLINDLEERKISVQPYRHKLEELKKYNFFRRQQYEALIEMPKQNEFYMSRLIDYLQHDDQFHDALELLQNGYKNLIHCYGQYSPLLIPPVQKMADVLFDMKDY